MTSPIIGVPTSIAAFVGPGAPESATPIANVSAFTRTGGKSGTPLALAVASFFDNGGEQAIVASDFSVLDNVAFNLLAMLPATSTVDLTPAEYRAALAYAASRQAMFLVDPPRNLDPQQAIHDLGFGGLDGDVLTYAAVYFPRITDLTGVELAPSGAVAGVMARTDRTRGVWSSPAGTTASIDATPITKIDDPQNAALSSGGINAIRQFPFYGTVLWGARTLVSAIEPSNDYKYIQVRRTIIYIEQSIKAALEPFVYSPNDASTWTAVRALIESFLQEMFVQGAFAGNTPKDAFQVTVDATTTTPADIEVGIMNVLVQVAPTRPAEYVVITIQQAMGA